MGQRRDPRARSWDAGRPAFSRWGPGSLHRREPQRPVCRGGWWRLPLGLLPRWVPSRRSDEAGHPPAGVRGHHRPEGMQRPLQLLPHRPDALRWLPGGPGGLLPGSRPCARTLPPAAGRAGRGLRYSGVCRAGESWRRTQCLEMRGSETVVRPRRARGSSLPVRCSHAKPRLLVVNGAQ